MKMSGIGNSGSALIAKSILKKIQAELAREIRSRQWYQHRVDMLQCEQHRMRDPERTLVCDIIANGTLLPDPDGKRYGTVSSKPPPLSCGCDGFYQLFGVHRHGCKEED